MPTFGRPTPRATKRFMFALPFSLVPAIEEIVQRDGYSNVREACIALLEASVVAYPRWGIKKGQARAIGVEVRGWVLNRVRDDLLKLAAELEASLSTPMQEDLVEPDAQEEGQP